MLLSNPVTIVRTQNSTDLTFGEHCFYAGPGHKRFYLNDGQPDVLNAIKASREVSGRLTGTVRVTAIKGTTDWYSLRSMGRDGNKVTVYLRGSSLIVIDGESNNLATIWREHA